MKNLSIIAIFLIIGLAGFSQTGYNLSVENRKILGEERAAFVLEINRGLELDIQKVWKRVMEKNLNAKTLRKRNEVTIYGVIIQAISPSPIDIYASEVQLDSSIRLYVAMYMDTIIIDPNGKEGVSVKARKFLNGMAKDVYIEVLTREKESLLEVQESTKKLRDSNVRSSNELEQEILSDSLKINTNNSEISILNKELVLVSNRYVAKKKQIAEANTSNKSYLKEEKSKLKDLKKQRKSIEKEIQERSKDVLTLKAEIRDNKYKLDQIQSDLISIDQELNFIRTKMQGKETELRNLK